MKQTLCGFSNGEITTHLGGRIDLTDMRSTACKVLLNAYAKSFGPAIKRPGTKFVAKAGNNSKVQLIPFEYSNEQAYMLEFGENYIRFFKNGGQIWTTISGIPQGPYELSTSILESSLKEMKHTQSADVMYITEDSGPKVLTRYAHAVWDIQDYEVDPPPFLKQNKTDLTLTPSAVEGGITISGSDDVFDSEMIGGYFKFSGILKREATITAEDTWTDPIIMNDGDICNISISNTWAAGLVTLQKSTDRGVSWVDFSSSDVNRDFQIVEAKDEVYYRIGIKTGNWVSGTCDVSISNSNEYGYVKIDDVYSLTSASGTVEKELMSVESTTTWSESAWSDYRGWPKSVSFYEQRLTFGGNKHRPHRIWATKTEDYTNFENRNNNDNESYNYSFYSQTVNTIQWLINKNVLHVGTAGGEWRFGYKVEGGTTPSTVFAGSDSTKGSNHIQGIDDTDGNILFISKGGNQLFARLWDYEDDRFKPVDISSKAEHLLLDGIEEVCFSQSPNPMIFLLTTTGKIVVCTYNLESKIIAWSSYETDGEVESFGVIPNSSTKEDELWIAVRRDIDGKSEIYIEYFDKIKWTDHSDVYYVDSGIEHNGAPISILYGLDHLEGKEVKILSEGSPTSKTHTVENGSVVLDYPSTKIIVGLPYEFLLETMNIESAAKGISSIGKDKHISNVVIDVEKTIGAWVGYDKDFVEIIPFSKFGDLYDTTTPPFSGLVETQYNTGYEEELSIVIKHSDPLPIEVKSITFDLKING